MPDLDKNKRIILLVLTLLVLIIWGHTGLRIWNQLETENEIFKEANFKKGFGWQGIDSTWFNWRYPKKLRDPFSVRSTSVKNKSLKTENNKQKNTQASQQPTKPKVYFYGMVSTAGNHVALVEVPPNRIIKVHNGDQIDSLLIEKITEKYIIVRYKNHCYRYELKD